MIHARQLPGPVVGFHHLKHRPFDHLKILLTDGHARRFRHQGTVLNDQVWIFEFPWALFNDLVPAFGLPLRENAPAPAPPKRSPSGTPGDQAPASAVRTPALGRG